jgi:predicted RNA-binding protein associated with RNAse of E/G family
LEALFNHLDMPFSDVILRQNDRFVETFFTNRWYNIFEIHDRDDDRIKGWYCDICTPAVLEGSQVSYVDLALDLWISTDGRPTIMDEGDFEKLELDDDTRQNALAGLDELMQTLNSNKPPE